MQVHRSAKRKLINEEEEPRITALLFATFVGQAAYAPRVRKWPVDDHKRFLITLLDNHVQLSHRFGLPVWTAGDLNLRGVVEGESAGPTGNAVSISK